MIASSPFPTAYTSVVSAPAFEPAPRVSVIVVNYNGGEHLKQCLHALMIACHQRDEIILVDNASTDSSAQDLEDAFPGVRVIRSSVNLGFGEGNNLGVRFANGKYLAFLNPDTAVEAGWLSALIDALDTDLEAGLATSKILLLSDPGRINTCGNDIHCTGLTLCRGMGMERTAFSDQTEVCAVSGAAFVVRRELFEMLGGFDGTFFLYMEDTDLSWRACLAGYRCLYVPSSIVYHDYSLRFGPEKMFYQERNRYLMLLKNWRWPTLLLLMPALLEAEVITWGFALLRERQCLANKLQAYAWIIKHWDQVMQGRRQVQATRRVRDRDLLRRCTYRLAYEQTGDGYLARLAHIVFDPLFFILQRWALVLMRW